MNYVDGMNSLLAEHGDLLVDEEHPLPSAEPDKCIIKYKCNTAEDELSNNVRLAIARELPRFFGETVREGLDDEGRPCWRVKWSKHPIAIVAGGPTLRETIGRLKDFKTVMSAGSSHDYLVSQGIVPDYCVLMDGIPEAIDWLKHPQKTTTYLAASQNNPIMFDHLKGYNVHLWHAMGLEDSVYGDEPTVGGGSTTALRCLELAFLMGFWDMHFFGLDSCYADDGTTHAYDDWANPQTISIKVHNSSKERTFHTDVGLLGQAEFFIETFKARKKFMRATIHGDGLIAETVRYHYGSDGIRVAP